MKPPGPIIAFLATWSAMLLEYAAYVVYYKITTTEPDMKFGNSAPYITLTLLGGLGGFVAGLAALAATFVYEERNKESVRASHILKLSAVASVPFAICAWYTVGWSPLSISGTLFAWFFGCATVFMALLYVGHNRKSAA